MQRSNPPRQKARRCCQKKPARDVPGGGLAFCHDKTLLISLLQNFSRNHPSGGDDLCAYPLSLRNVEDLLHERGIDISHEAGRFWWNRFGPMLAAEIRKWRVPQLPVTGLAGEIRLGLAGASPSSESCKKPVYLLPQ